MTQNLDHLTDAQIALLIERVPDLPLQEKLELLEQLEQHDTKNARRRAREDFLTFCHRVYPGFKEGPHHRNMAPLLQDMARPNGYTWDTADGRPPKHALRLTVSMAPRFGKSETIAYLYVAWYLGHNPKHQIMMVTHTEELSASFGKKVRDLIDTPEYQAIFEGACVVSKDKSAAGNWNTTAGGVYLALGVGGNAAGKGADLLVLDDLVSEQAVLYGNPETAFELELTVNKGRDAPYDLGEGYGHLAVSVDDLDAEHARLTEAGLAPGKRVDFAPAGATIARFFFLTDPDGYKIEVLQRGGRYL